MFQLLFLGILATDVPQSPVIELLDAKLSKATATITPSGWETTVPLELRLENSPELKFQAISDGDIGVAVASSALARPAKPDVRFVKLQLTGKLKPPTATYLYSPGMKSPVRLELGVKAPPPEWMDWIVVAALFVSVACVATGFKLSGKGLLDDIGQQTFSTDSWVTNLTLAGGLLALVLKLFPTGSDGMGPYTLLSAAAALIAGASPVLFNLTTRLKDGARKGIVILFLISGMLTSAAAMTQVATAVRALMEAQIGALLGPVTLKLALTILVAVLVALAIYVARSTDETIRAQVEANTKQAEAIGPRARQSEHGTWTYPAL